MNELLLLPAAAEECLMTVILYLHCEQAALKCIEHFMKTEVKAATEPAPERSESGEKH